jgi:hypothetical protein
MDETPLAISQQMERHSPSNPVEETAGTAPTEAVTAKRRRQRKATPQIEQGASQIDQSYMVSLRAKLDPIMKGSEESTIPLETTLDHERQRRRKRRRRRAAGGEIQETEDTVSRAISFQTSNIEEGAPPLINDNRNTSEPDNIDDNRRSQTALDSNDDHQQQHNTLIGSDETDRIDNQRDPNGLMALVDSEDIREGLPRIAPNTTIGTEPLHKQPDNTIIYRQQTNSGEFIHHQQENTDNINYISTMTNSRLALYIHWFINRNVMILHGITAGVSLWDTAVSFSISADSHVTLLLHYYKFPLWLHALYLLVTSAAIVILFDRFDVAKINKNCLQMCYRSLIQIFQAIALVMLITSLLVITVSIFLDARIAAFTQHPELWLDVLVNSTTCNNCIISVDGQHYARSNGAMSGYIIAWLVLSVIRTAVMCISWLISMWTTNSDRIEEYLNQSNHSNNEQNNTTMPP